MVAVHTEADPVETLKGPGLVTLFALTDEAVAKISKVDLDKMLAHNRKLKSVLTYHVEPDKVMSENIKPGTVNKAKAISANAAADNGVIYAIKTC